MRGSPVSALGCDGTRRRGRASEGPVFCAALPWRCPLVAPAATAPPRAPPGLMVQVQYTSTPPGLSKCIALCMSARCSPAVFSSCRMRQSCSRRGRMPSAEQGASSRMASKPSGSKPSGSGSRGPAAPPRAPPPSPPAGPPPLPPFEEAAPGGGGGGGGGGASCVESAMRASMQVRPQSAASDLTAAILDAVRSSAMTVPASPIS
jgi:hypothetical protein